jgi:methionyl-tRNA formyltransferase
MPSEINPRPDVVGRAPCVLFAYHEMGYACMDALVAMGAPIAALFTHRDDPHEEIWWRSCIELAGANRISVHTPDKLDGWAGRIAALSPAIIYSFYYRYLIAPEILSLAPLGAYNMHGSMLPKYRGRAPVNWMIANGEREAGVTLHRMVARADAGDIVAQRAVRIEDADTALTLYRKLVPAAVAILTEYHPMIAAGTAPSIPMNLESGSYYGRRRPEDGRIEWSWPARRIFNLVRAVTHPYPGAFCSMRGRKLFVWKAVIAAESGACAAPGTVVGSSDAGAIDVAAGEGVVRLISVQFEGATEGSAAEAIGAWAIEILS